MLSTKCSSRYVSTGTNKRRNILDWSIYLDLVVFGSSNKLYLVSNNNQSRTYQITSSFAAHDGPVTCVRWVEGERCLCSSSADGVVCAWRLSIASTLDLICRIPAHKLSADFVTGHAVDSQLFVLSASIDGTVKVHQTFIDKDLDNSFSLLQTIVFDPGFAICIAAVHVWQSTLLAVGCNDCAIHLFTKSDSEEKFKLVHKLIGHTDWVTDVQFSTAAIDSFFLASCSQDTYSRVWRFQLHSKEDEEKERDVLKLDQQPIFLRQQATTTNVLTYFSSLETVLAGHEGWVYSVRWCSDVASTSGCPKLITASIDKCIIEWEPDTVSGIWFEKTRIGDVGGNSLGFFGAVYSPDGMSILGHSYAGGLHLWSYDKETDRWEPQVVPTGHFGAVEDLEWDPNGHYLLTVSVDQTTRLHGVWAHQGLEPSYHELARTQVHGYDMQCIASLNSFVFVSAGEEKILRSFSASTIFCDNFAAISKIDLPIRNHALGDIKLAEGASVPSLGLTNKAVFSEASLAPAQHDHSDDQGPLHYFTPVRLLKPPTEDHLLQNTLWPEVHKMYGHGFEVFCVASNSNGSLFASACKASKPEHTAILLWSAKTWQQVGSLSGHTLTVTQLAFAPNDQYLLSVSRDRTWCLFRKGETDDPGGTWRLVGRDPAKGGAHSRIIWTCAWSHDSAFFATGSRDKKLSIWKLSEPDSSDDPSCRGPVSLRCTFTLCESVTALSFAPTLCYTKYLIAAGLENGVIELYSFDGTLDALANVGSMDSNIAHSKTVKRLQFRPVTGRLGFVGEETAQDCCQLASAGEDHSVHIYDVVYGM